MLQLIIPKWRLTELMLILLISACQPAFGGLITYQYSGQITEITENENNAIPNLSLSDTFSGYLTFESTGWHGTSGTILTSINGVDLLFTGQWIYGAVTVDPSVSYSIRIAADTGGNINGSTFSAGNFGPTLTDTNGSAGISEEFPNTLTLAEFEVNQFLIWGSMIATGDRIIAKGQLTEFTLVPEPSSSILMVIPFLAMLHYGRRHRY